MPAAIFTIWRLVAREPVTQALAGLLGIGLGAGLALFTGRAQDFFIPGIVKNLGSALSTRSPSLVRYPLIGLLLGFTLGEELHWRKVPARMRVYQQATWVWVGMFAVRALIQGRLYAQGNATTLGFVNVILGLPLFGVAVALTWLLVRRVPPAKPHADAEARAGRRSSAGEGAQWRGRPGLSSSCSSSSLSGTVTNISSSFASSVSSRLGAIGRSSRRMQTSTVSARQHDVADHRPHHRVSWPGASARPSSPGSAGR